MLSTHLKRPLVAVAAMLLIAGTAACTGGDEASPTPTLEPAPTGEVSDGGGAVPATSAPGGEQVAGECQVQEGDDSLPTEAPPVDGWEDVSGVGVPVSDTYGPYVQDGELWTCYEHSATGAILAAHYAYAAMGSVGGFGEEWVPAGDFQEKLTSAETASTPPIDGAITPAGFRVASYSAERAVVDVALEFANADGTALMSMRWTLTWDDDRWLIEPAAAETMEPVALESLDGYVRWGSTDG
ncbi:hypothetical protein [Brachybacterium sp. UNK5269]|uniref:hypothetical protein n=1 Tax=Brachybacterium sp. UNK5269 TaxID=3408576 RepID=UPI003BAE529C